MSQSQIFYFNIGKIMEIMGSSHLHILHPFVGHIDGGGVVGQKLVKILGNNGTEE